MAREGGQESYAKLYGIIQQLPASICTLTQLWLAEDSQHGGVLSCPPELIPGAGQYLQAYARELGEINTTTLFSAGREDLGVKIAPALPNLWHVGLLLQVRGPLGKGFHLPVVKKIALAATTHNFHRLIPLVYSALAQDAAITLFTPSVPQSLPAVVEALPLDQLPEALSWADFLAIDLSYGDLVNLRTLLNLSHPRRCPCPAQVLITIPMPCGAIGECGVCTVRTVHGWKRACQDGPVFDLDDLLL
jgi:hypothetical protein